jgi:hypothetical protein
MHVIVTPLKDPYDIAPLNNSNILTIKIHNLSNIYDQIKYRSIVLCIGLMDTRTRACRAKQIIHCICGAATKEETLKTISGLIRKYSC